MTKSVAFTIESMGGGGAQIVMLHLINGLLEKGLRVHLITTQGSETDFFDVPENVERHVLGGARRSSNPLSAIFSNLRRIMKLRRAVRDSNPSCVISFVATQNVLALLACKGLHIPVIISERNDPERQDIGRVWSILRRLSYPSASFVTANSQLAISFLKDLVPADRLRLVPNPVRTFDPANIAVMAEPFFLAIGRLDQQKAFDTLIDAYAIARRQSSLPPLLILGKGPEQKALTKQISELGIASSVFLVGEVTNVGDYYHWALALLHPARFEGMPNVVLEAMGTGTPVVVSNSQGGILDLVSDDVSAIIFNTDDVNQLAEVIRQLNDNPALRERLGNGAKTAIADRLQDDGVSAWLDIMALVTNTSLAGEK